MDLSSVMNPKSIVLVGASTRDHTIGHDLLHRLIDYGFQGDLYLVNPKGGVWRAVKFIRACPLSPMESISPSSQSTRNTCWIRSISATKEGSKALS